MADDGVTSSNVISGLIGGAAGATLAFLGSWGLVKRAEGRARKAKLKAIESELRANRVLIEAVVNGDDPPGQLSRDIWDRTNIDLAVDTSSDTYKALQNFYWLFAAADPCWHRVKEGKASGKDKENLNYWRDQCYAAQVCITGEMHVLWRIRTTSTIWAKRVTAWLKRRAPWVRDTEVKPE
jgi:hypothetical protein